MKTWKNIRTVIAAMLLGAGFIAAQTNTVTPPAATTWRYSNAFGIRAGMTSGVTFKHFFGGSNNAMEVIFGVWPDALGFTALYERHEATEIDGLFWYFGGGAHATGGNNRNYYRYDSNDRRYLYRYGASNFAAGIDGVIGAEYKVKQIPFAFSLDMKPMLEVNDLGEAFMYIDPSIGIKVAF